MAKSTQDLCILLNQVACELGYEVASLTFYTDKSFQIDGQRVDSAQILLNSDEMDGHYDINDLGYLSAEEIVTHIKLQAAAKAQESQPVKRDLAAEARARLEQGKQTGKFDNL